MAVGSRVVERPWEGTFAAAYAASKAALVSLVRTTGAELAGSGVRVNAVLPSTIDTPENRKTMPGADHGRWVTVTEVCSTIEFLLSRAAAGMTGNAIPIYGRVK